MAKNITPRNKNFPEWYQDVISAGELADNAPVRGCMVIRPTAFSLWEKMQAVMDRKFKETGHVNAYFPLLIPENFLQKEAEHVEGFSPELAVVSHAGGKELEEKLIIRPTSETVIGHMYSKWLNSYRDLPILINQWCNVMRWEMRPRVFLRTSEFLWQEGHTAHETEKEAREETLRMLEVYRSFLEESCAIPVITGEKPIHEKFPGAIDTYTLEAMMQDRKALQSGTSHYLGQNFAKAFDIKFLGRDNTQQLVYTTSWGTSTRMIGGVIMTHGDDDGVVFPPGIAPTKVVILPMFKNEADKGKIMMEVDKIKASLSQEIDPIEIAIDQKFDSRPSDRFFHWIQRGVPLRIEFGPKDAEKGSAMMVRRDTAEKKQIPLDVLATEVSKTLKSIQSDMFAKAKRFRDENIFIPKNYAEMSEILIEGGGFIKAGWDGNVETANKVKADLKSTVRVLLNEPAPGNDPISGQAAKHTVIYAQAY